MKPNSTKIPLSEDELVTLARGGNATAQLMLAVAEANGWLAPASGQFAPALNATEDQDPLAKYFVGHLMLTKDPRSLEGRNLVISAAQTGVSVAATLLGVLALSGLGTQNDPEEAERWLLKGASHGDPAAWGWLGSRYLTSTGTFTDLDKAEYFFRKGVDEGDITSISRLAEIYFLRGGEHRSAEALSLLERGVQANDFSSLMRLSYLKRTGMYGVEKDVTSADELAQRARALLGQTGRVV